MESVDDKNLALLSHVLGLLTGFLGPLIMYLAIDSKKTFVRNNSKNALNFQLTLLIGYVIAIILSLILIGFLLIPVLFILNLIFSIKAAVGAGNNETYVYPIAITFLK